jgi:hypothetical protein
MQKDYKILLEWYDLDTEKLVDEEEIDKTDEELAILLGMKEKYPPFIGTCYRVTNNDKKILQPLVDHNIDFNKYSYLLGSYATNLDQGPDPCKPYYDIPEWKILEKTLQGLKDRGDIETEIPDKFIIRYFFNDLKENNCLKNMSS